MGLEVLTICKVAENFQKYLRDTYTYNRIYRISFTRKPISINEIYQKSNKNISMKVVIYLLKFRN